VASCCLVFIISVHSWVEARYVVEVAVFCHSYANMLCELHDLGTYVYEEGIAGPAANEHDGVYWDAGHVHGHSSSSRSDQMGSTFFGFEAEGFSSHTCDGVSNEGVHFFPSDLDEFSWVVGGWGGGRLKERAYRCVFGRAG
jgi:hypothetical protein